MPQLMMVVDCELKRRQPLFSAARSGRDDGEIGVSCSYRVLWIYFKIPNWT